MTNKISSEGVSVSQTIVKVMLVQPKIAANIMVLQLQHALPVNITIGMNEGRMKKVSIMYKEHDENMVEWLVDKATQMFLQSWNRMKGVDYD